MSLNLKDPSLLRQQCYVDGAWVDADAGGTVDGHQPGHRRGDRHRAELGAAETRRAIEAADARVARLARRRPPRSARRSCAAGST